MPLCMIFCQWGMRPDYLLGEVIHSGRLSSDTASSVKILNHGAPLSTSCFGFCTTSRLCTSLTLSHVSLLAYIPFCPHFSHFPSTMLEHSWQANI